MQSQLVKPFRRDRSRPHIFKNLMVGDAVQRLAKPSERIHFPPRGPSFLTAETPELPQHVSLFNGVDLRLPLFRKLDCQKIILGLLLRKTALYPPCQQQVVITRDRDLHARLHPDREYIIREALAERAQPELNRSA